MTAVLLPLAPLQGDLIPSTLVPLFIEWRRDGRSLRMMSSLCAVFAAIAATLAVLIALFTPPYIELLFGGFAPETKAMTVSFSRVMTLAMPASVLIASFGCVEIGLGRSRMTTLRSSVQNLSVLAGIGLMVLTGDIRVIAWSFVAGLSMVALYGLVSLWCEGELSPAEIRLGSGLTAFGVFFRRARPLLIQPLAEQSSTLLERLLASGLAVGTFASLDYARTITETVYFTVSQPVGYVVLGQAPSDDMRDRVRALCRPILHLGLPASVFVITFARDVTIIVFGRGAFQSEAIDLTTTIMQGIGAGLWATTLGWILIRLLNIQNRNGIVARVLAGAYVANMVTNVLTYRWLGPLGLGLGEAMRGVVLLGGAASALGCFGLLLRLVAQAVPVTALLGVAGVLIESAFGTPLTRLAAGMAIYAIVLVPWILLCMPEVGLHLFKHIGPLRKRVNRTD